MYEGEVLQGEQNEMKKEGINTHIYHQPNPVGCVEIRRDTGGKPFLVNKVVEVDVSQKHNRYTGEGMKPWCVGKHVNGKANHKGNQITHPMLNIYR